jgi:hypothetical protein
MTATAQDAGARFKQGGDIQAAPCAACLAGRQSQRGTSGGVSDPPLRLAA